MRLPGRVQDLALARSIDAKHFALIASAGVERAVGRHGERPDVFGLWREIFRRLAVLDAIDFAVGRSGGIDRAFGVRHYGENLGLVGGPDERALAGFVNAIQASAVPRGHVE